LRIKNIGYGKEQVLWRILDIFENNLSVEITILNSVHQSLRVLDADPHGERLGFEQDSRLVQQLVDVAGGLACGKPSFPLLAPLVLSTIV